MKIPHIDNLETANSTLTRNLGVEVRDYSTFNFGREKDEKAISFIISEKKALELLPKIRDAIRNGLIALHWHNEVVRR